MPHIINRRVEEDDPSSKDDYFNLPPWVEDPNMSLEDNNVIETVELTPPGQLSHSSGGSTPQLSRAPAKTEQHNPVTIETNHDVKGPSACVASSSSPSSSTSRSALPSFAKMMECSLALVDPDHDVSNRLMGDSHDALKNHYAPDVETFYRNPANTFAPGLGRVFESSQIQYPGSGLNNRNYEFQFLLQQITYPINHSIQLIHTKGYLPALSVDPYGSRFIQKKPGTATTGEIMMVYKEIMPHVRTLIFDVFASYTIQKLLEHGPPFCRRELVGNLLGHVFGLSFHQYGYRVIQKAFELSEFSQQIEMANELGSNILKCVLDQYANIVVQQCIESMSPYYIQFIYTSLCGKAKMLSSHPYGCHVIQKMLEFCTDPQIMHALVSEIVEYSNELSASQFGNYVVQYIVEHGGDYDRHNILLKLAGRIVHLSCQKYSSNVIEKCLIYGSYHDRQLVATEIILAGGGQTANHLLGMMIHQYGNYVVQKLIYTVDEGQFNVIVDVVRRNVDMRNKYIHGKHVVTQVGRILNMRARLLGSMVPPRFIR